MGYQACKLCTTGQGQPEMVVLFAGVLKWKWQLVKFSNCSFHCINLLRLLHLKKSQHHQRIFHLEHSRDVLSGNNMLLRGEFKAKFWFAALITDYCWLLGFPVVVLSVYPYCLPPVISFHYDVLWDRIILLAQSLAQLSPDPRWRVSVLHIIRKSQKCLGAIPLLLTWCEDQPNHFSSSSTSRVTTTIFRVMALTCLILHILDL